LKKEIETLEKQIVDEKDNYRRLKRGESFEPLARQNSQ